MTSTIVFTNNANSTLASPINNTATTVVLATGTGAEFPSPGAGQYFVFTLRDAATGLVFEVMRCTVRTGDTLTVVRGQEGTSAVNWLAGDAVFHGVTSGTLSAFAQSDSAAFTNTPTAPNASPGTNSNQIATTAFVSASFAPKVSPALTGTPTAPTAASSTNTTQIATTAFVQGLLASISGTATDGEILIPQAGGAPPIRIKFGHRTAITQNTAATFASGFPNTVLWAMACTENNGTGSTNNGASVFSLNTSSVSVSTNAVYSFYWIAVGY